MLNSRIIYVYILTLVESFFSTLQKTVTKLNHNIHFGYIIQQSLLCD